MNQEEINRILKISELGYRQGFVDGYNLGCPMGENAKYDDFNDLLTPAIEKTRKEFLKNLTKIIKVTKVE